jgi:RNA polymerase sigma-70 factor, ECF subfamily
VAVGEEVTRLLIEWKSGSKEAMDLLVPLVYDEMRRLAQKYLRDEGSAATLQPTALVHEAYLRLVAQSLPDWESRSHFFGVAAHLMRQVLVDHARKHKSGKRGGRAPKAPFEEALNFAPERSSEVLALDDALNALAVVDPRFPQVNEAQDRIKSL